jgi:TorA maturation chaperone TorD
MTGEPQLAVSTDIEASARTAMERSGVYGFLAEIFRAEPSPELLRRMRDGGFLEILAAVGADLGDDFVLVPSEELLADMAVEYARLFLGPGPHVQPYAAIYLGGEGASLCGPATTWARGFMEWAGFSVAPEHRVLPDHASVELEFMARMAEREAQALEESDTETAERCRGIQKEFLDKHLGRWLPQFCVRTAEHAELSFYREMARLAGHFVKSEVQYFAGPDGAS